MTNLTKQEIQDTLDDLLHYDTIPDSEKAKIQKIMSFISIAEKQVWLPISEIPKKVNFFTEELEPSGLYQLKGILSHQDVYALAHMVEGEWFYPCYVRCIDDDTEMEGSYLLGFEPTHYMPLPTPHV